MAYCKVLIAFLFALILVADVQASTIVASRTAGVAPLYVSFYDSDATASDGSGPEPFHDYEYIWSFGDTGAGNWGTTGKSKNSSKGPVAAHVYESAGIYQVSLTVRSADGTIGEDTATITVSDPGTVYATTLTTCVNNIGDSDFTGCPSGANQVNSDDVTALIDYAQDGERLLFKRGGAWTVGSLPLWPNSDGPVTIGAYGSCTNPNAQGICSNAPQFAVSAGFIDIAYHQDMRIMDIRVVGEVSGGLSIYDFSQILFLRVDVEDSVSGAALGWGHYNDATPMTIDQMAIVACNIIDSAEMGMYVGSERLGILGNVFSDSGTTHLVRVWQSFRGVIQHNTFDSSTTEGPNQRHLLKFHGPDDLVEDPEHCTPTNGTGCLANYTEFSIISDNIFGASGAMAVTIAPQSSMADTQISDIIYERNYTVRDWGSYYGASNMNNALLIVGRYISVRNNIFDASNGAADFDFIVLDKYPSETTGVRLLNNTMYRSDASNDFNDGIVINSGCTNTVARNNLLSVANVTGPVTMISDSGTGTTASNNQVIDNPNFTNPNNADPLSRDFTLQSGSLAIDKGYTVEVLDDYADLCRIGLFYDLGAHEYGAPQTQGPDGNDSGSSGGCFVITSWGFKDFRDNH